MKRTSAISQHRPRSLAVVAWLRLARVQQKIERATMERLRRWDLSTAQFDILAHVGANEGITQQELAEIRLTTKGNLSQLLERMEADGLVCRVREGHAKRISLTEAGRRLFVSAVPAVEATIDEQFCALQPEEQSLLLRLLRTLDRALAPG